MAENWIKVSLLQAGISIDDAIVIGGGIMNTLGLRQSHDIDIVLPEDQWGKLVDNLRFMKAKKFDDTYFQEQDGLIEAWPYWWDMKENVKITFQELQKDTVAVDGVTYISLPFLRQWKIGYGRAKDLADVGLIDEYLKEKNVWLTATYRFYYWR